MHKVLFTQTPTFHLVTYWPRLGAVLAAAFLCAVGMIGMAHAECGGTMSYAVCDNVKVVELTPYVDSPVYVRVSGTMTALHPYRRWPSTPYARRKRSYGVCHVARGPTAEQRSFYPLQS